MSKPLRVLIVDDSVTFRSAIKTALSTEANIEVVGAAANGKIALAKLEGSPADVVILAMEMPEMDGIATLNAIKERGFPTRVMLFGAPAQRGDERVREALAKGAVDFLTKPPAGGTSADAPIDSVRIESIREEILPKLRLLSGGPRYNKPADAAPNLAPKPQTVPGPWPQRDLNSFKPSAIVIASSTGGPMALEKLFAVVQGRLTLPVLMVQHMPPPFTKSLAVRLGEISGVPIKEAVDGEPVKPGNVYIAPAMFHLTLEGTRSAPVARVRPGPRINFVIPAADPLFETAAEIYQDKLMGFVLTGMGEDGKAGAVRVKQTGGGIMIQDQATAVVWGMPGAVHEVQAFDRIGSLDECAQTFRRMTS